MSEFQKESLSLQETNKLRISLGLKPLTDDGPSETAPAATDSSGSDAGNKSARQVDEDAEAERRHAQQIERNRRDKEEREIRERIAKAQNRRELARKLQGPTLADPDAEAGPSTSAAGASSSSSSSQDTLRWLKQAKKRAKQNADKRAKELEEQEAQAQATYGESDLAGIRVAHDLENFDDGEEHVLTFRDARVLDDADDELVDSTLDQAERDRQAQERKKGRRDYTGLDDDEFGAETVGRKRGVLSKYDADIGDDGLTRSEGSGFVLGAGTKPSRKEEARKQLESEARAANKQLLSLDYTKNQEVSDYLQEGDVGFKKPKTKKRKKAARVKVDLDLDGDDGDDRVPRPAGPSASATATAATSDDDVAMDDEPTIQIRRPRARETENFVDDDELQASLAKARRQKAKRTFTKMTPEMIAKNLAAQRAAEEAERAASGSPFPDQAAASGGANGAAASVKREDDDGNEGGVTFDNTSEFVRSIGHRQAAEQEDEMDRRRRATLKRESVSAEPSLAAAASVNGVTVKTEGDDARGDRDADQGNDKDVEFADAAEEYEAARIAAESGAAVDVGAGAPSADEAEVEPTVSKGLAGTLALLRNQGMLPGSAGLDQERERHQREYDRWLAQRRQEEQLRELERKASKAQGTAKDQATREYENRKRELDEARTAQDRFRDYRPDVDIKYHDEFGRTLTSHEAWKQLSHVFHGKKPGAKKIEKRLKKIEDEKKRLRMESGDTPTGMLQAFQNRAERTGEAAMVLSVGSRGSAPSDLALLGPNTLSASTAAAAAASTSTAKGKGKKREADELGTVTTLGDGLDAGVSTSVSGVPNRGEQSVTTARRGWAAVGGGGSGLRGSFSPMTSSVASPLRPTERNDAGAAGAAAATAGGQPFRLKLGAEGSAATATVTTNGKRKAEVDR